MSCLSLACERTSCVRGSACGLPVLGTQGPLSFPPPQDDTYTDSYISTIGVDFVSCSLSISVIISVIAVSL